MMQSNYYIQFFQSAISLLGWKVFFLIIFCSVRHYSLVSQSVEINKDHIQGFKELADRLPPQQKNKIPPKYKDSYAWSNMMHRTDMSIDDISRLFNLHWQGKEITKGSGHKPFQRWLYRAESKLNGTERQQHTVKKLLAAQAQSTSKKISKQYDNAWQPLGPFFEPMSNNGVGRMNVIGFHPMYCDTLLAGSPAGGLWYTHNGGKTWQQYLSHEIIGGISDIVYDPLDPSTVYIATGDRDGGNTFSYGLLRSGDGGLNWTTAGPVPGQNGIPDYVFIDRLLIHPTNSEILLLATSEGILRSMNQGASWQTVLSDHRVRHMEFHPTNPDIIYATTDDNNPNGPNSLYYRSDDNGVTWMPIDLPDSEVVERMAIGVSKANSNIVYLLSSIFSTSNNFYELYKSTDAGLSFSIVPIDVKPFMGVQEWFDWVIAVNPQNDNEVLIGGVPLFRSEDGGETWAYFGRAKQSSTVHVDQHYVGYHPKSDIPWSAGDGGIWELDTMDGRWIPRNNGLNVTQYYRLSVAKTNKDQIVAGSQDNGSHRYYKEGVWKIDMGSDGVDNAIDPSDLNKIYLSQQYGTMTKSGDGGGSYEFMLSPSSLGSTNGAWVTPIRIDPSNPAHIYVGFSALWKSTDHGQSWTKLHDRITEHGTIREFRIAPSDPDRIYLADLYTIYRSSDRGMTWDTLPGIPPRFSRYNYIEIHPSDPDKLWVCNSEGLFVSSDAGETWENISDNLPGVSYNTILYHDIEDGEGLFVATDIGVYYKKGNSQWEQLGTGLPMVEITDLDYNKGANVLRAATFGRGIWEIQLDSVGSRMNCDSSFVAIQTALTSDTSIVASHKLDLTASVLNDPNIAFQAAKAICLENGFTADTGSEIEMQIGECQQKMFENGYLVNNENLKITYEFLDTSVFICINNLGDTILNDLPTASRDGWFLVTDINHNGIKERDMDPEFLLNFLSGSVTKRTVENASFVRSASTITHSWTFEGDELNSKPHLKYKINIPISEVSSTDDEVSISIGIYDGSSSSVLLFYPGPHRASSAYFGGLYYLKREGER